MQCSCCMSGLTSIGLLLQCRKQESEADEIGMQLAAKACFDPAAAALVFEKLGAAEKQQGVKIPTLLRTHPISEVCCALIMRPTVWACIKVLPHVARSCTWAFLINYSIISLA